MKEHVTVNPGAPAEPWVTTWIVIKDEVDWAALSEFTLSLGGAVMCHWPARPRPGAPGGYAEMSFTTTDDGTARRQHNDFVLTSGKWLNARDAGYAWQYADGDWHHAGP